MHDRSPLPIRQWITIPAIITLAITLSRLFGELLNLSPSFFSREGGGAGALIGIVWLVPIFGVHFALKLKALGDVPLGLGKAFAFVIVAFAAPLVAGSLGPKPPALQGIVVTCIVFLFAILIARPAWPSLARVLWAYALTARGPVILVMLAAILGNWGTHYDVPPPNFPAVSPIVKWLLIGVFPQLTLWMGFTVIVGMFFGLLAVAVSRKRG